MMAPLIYVRDQMWPTVEPTALCQEGLSSRRTAGVGRALQEPFPAGFFTSAHAVCVWGGGSPRTPQLTSCHSPEVDIGEEEQQHQRGHDQPTVDKLDKETGRMTVCRPNAQLSRPPGSCD